MEGKHANFEEEKRVQVDDVDDDFDGQDSDFEEDYVSYRFMPSPLVPLKVQLEKDKDDDSLRRWKEKLLGDVERESIGFQFFPSLKLPTDYDFQDFMRAYNKLSSLPANPYQFWKKEEDQIEPEIKFHSIGIVPDGREQMFIPLPIEESQNRVLFTAKEGEKYRLKLTFSVQHNIVSGLAYRNTVWKGNHKVDQTKGMLGTFAPRSNPYEEMLEAETTPSGIFARGIYSAKLQFKDDDNRNYLELNYSFEIKKS